ncbi:uncharacterized protein BT62DRAFT_699541 [Guyanagaster necrorhizus]|uniref:Uncharacterized protein n=1 Tax=Guyanagaster necrorhizus TaxID=856835 RepID=A0A9P8AM57_9AGAR|nr:uncharacterized protein BT62DRAFT_699541 [Guyanagaster necrorhizus MCA 3950]KAG7439522.1 hypothetical protein BT62DRAFT_699541 [Guyanagaster necrorhizus MCA 3950]
MCYRASKDHSLLFPQVVSFWTGQSTGNRFEKLSKTRLFLQAQSSGTFMHVLRIHHLLPTWIASDDADISEFDVGFSLTLPLCSTQGWTVELKIPRPPLTWGVMAKWCCVLCGTISWAKIITSPSP